MPRTPRSAVLVLAALLTCLAAPSRAVPIQYAFSGRALNTPPVPGPVHAGDRFVGSFFFDPDRVIVRWNIDGSKGYDFQPAAAGLEIQVATSTGTATFGTLPGYVLSEVENDYTYGPGYPQFDRFWIFGGDETNFPAIYHRIFTQIYLDVFSFTNLSLTSSTDLPAHLTLVPNSSAYLYAYGGPNFARLDYFFSFAVDHIDLANRPPDCSAAVGHIPPGLALDGRWAPVTIDGVTDPDGDPVTIAVTRITQDEPVQDIGARPTCPDGVIVDGAAEVRMERSGTGNGRVYRVAFTASDGRGGSCDGAVTVCVPHDLGAGASCVDDGTQEESTVCGDISRTPSDLASASRAPGELRVARIGPKAWAFEFSMPGAGEASLSVVDVAGRSVVTLGRSFASGAHRLEWRADGYPPGVYFARLRTPDGSVVRRFIVL